MEQKLGRGPAVIGVLAASAAAYFLRRSQLQSGSTLFSWISLAAVILFAAYSIGLRPKETEDVLVERSLILTAGQFLSALAILGGSFAMFMARENKTDLLLAAGGMVTAVCFLGIAMTQLQGRKAVPGLYMVPSLIYAIRLICEFRDWSRDPMIMDYCFDLFALIAIMCATYHLGGFCFGKGRRRMTVFFCLCGIFFGAAAIAGGRPRDILITGGGMVWLLSSLWPILRKTE